MSNQGLKWAKNLCAWGLFTLNSDEGNIVKVLEQFNVFTPLDGSTESLHSIATKDVATPEIQESLLSADELGQSKLDTFVEERLVNSTVEFRDR